MDLSRARLLGISAPAMVREETVACAVAIGSSSKHYPVLLCELY
jgi:hypothetical protein